VAPVVVLAMALNLESGQWEGDVLPPSASEVWDGDVVPDLQEHAGGNL
jgi:hypothetical protein